MADMLLGGIVINEILADPNTSPTSGFDTNQDGSFEDEDEFIEILNTSDTAIDISGLQLWDEGIGNWFTFPEDTTLQPGAHAMVMTGFEGTVLTGDPGDLFFYAERNSAVINNGGDNVVIFDPGNNEYISATFGGTTVDPTTRSDFPDPATQSGSGENFGGDIDGNSIQRSPDGADTFVNDEAPTPGTTNVCFTGGTQFETADGIVLIENIRPGDLLKTHDGRLVAVKWIWAKRWMAQDLRKNPKLWPVKIERHAFGKGIPHRAMYVSQHHRLLVSSRIAERMFGQPDILVPAKDLLDIEGVTLVHDSASLTYYHILFDTHEVIWADGIPAESLFLGAEVLKSLSPEALEELCLIFRTTCECLANIDFETKWLFATGKRARKLAQRHAKNTKSLYSDISVLGPKAKPANDLTTSDVKH